MPVCRVPEPPGPLACEPLHRHQPPGADLGTIVVFDHHTTRGAWRREWCCQRCVSELTARHPEAVVWVPSGRDGIPDQPPPCGQLAQWPADAVGGAA